MIAGQSALEGADDCHGSHADEDRAADEGLCKGAVRGTADESGLKIVSGPGQLAVDVDEFSKQRSDHHGVSYRFTISFPVSDCLPSVLFISIAESPGEGNWKRNCFAFYNHI